MKKITTIDLWTEQTPNQYECFNGCFIDGFVNGNIPFNRYKIVKNCNCVISCSNSEINISNKHQAIIFYKKNYPVRLLIANRKTDLEKCITNALNQTFNEIILQELFSKQKIKYSLIDMKEKPIKNNADPNKEIDTGSCDRWNLLFSMLKGSYTEDESKFGNYDDTKYEFIPNINIEYRLQTDKELFNIKHNCAFINEMHTRIIPIQEKSSLTK